MFASNCPECKLPKFVFIFLPSVAPRWRIAVLGAMPQSSATANITMRPLPSNEGRRPRFEFHYVHGAKE